MSERRGVKGLELWCKKVTSGYPGVKVENMTTSWRNGLAFCAIIHRFRPDLIDFFELNKDDIYKNNELAFRVAEHHLGIPALLEPLDMVQYEVPDRLSILTYLSQFYQAFAVREGPNSITGKRLQAPPDHEIGSPTSSSPPSKVASFGIGRARRQPCAKCNLHVYIAERLTVGKSLFHRPCFRCARCGAQLAPASYYETENGEYCCEVCPDEEKPSAAGLRRIPSGGEEEPPADLSIVNSSQPDDYSAVFEAALESVSSSPSPALVAKRADLEQFLGYEDHTRDFPTDPPRSSDNNVSLSFDNNLESIDNVTKEEKQLSVRARMRLFEDSSDVRGVSNNFKTGMRPSSYVKGRKGVVDNNNKPENVTNSENSDRLNESNQAISNSDSSNEPSRVIPKSNELTLVKETDTLENTSDEVSKCADDNVEVITIDSSSEEKSFDSKIPLLVNPQNQDLKQNGEILECTDEVIVIESSPENNYAAGNVSQDSFVVNSEDNDSKDINIKVNYTDEIILESTTSSNDVIVIDSTTSEEQKNQSIVQESIISPAQDNIVKSISDAFEEVVQSPDSSTDLKQRSLSPGEDNSIGEFLSVTYPVELNPFGDEEEAEYKPIPPTRKKQSGAPLPAERKKDVIPSRKKISIPTQYKNDTYSGDDLNPFDEEEDEDESTSQSYVSASNIPTPQPRRRKISLPPECKKQMATMPVHRLTINPSDGSQVVIKKNMGSYDEYLNPFADVNDDESEDSSLRQSYLSTSAHLQDSRHPNSSLSIDTSIMFGSASSISSGSIHGSARKKKPAPRPPVLGVTFNGGSVTSSPSQSAVPSPSAVRKHRKDRKAPPPPIVTSTPVVKSLAEGKVEMDVKENEDQEQIHRNAQSGLSRFSHLNKSTHGRWKQKKSQAPSLPIPQRRTIKSLPMSDIRRELDLIEVQQQGLEKQSVKIEQMIREKEGDESDMGEDLPIEVEDLLLQLFEIVNEKNELLRKQTELMYLKKEQRLEEEHAEIEYQIRCLMAKPEDQKTASDKAKEDELIKLLVDVVERRNEIIKCLDMDRVKEAEEDSYISSYVDSYTAKRDKETLPLEEKKQEHKEKVESKDTLRKKLKRKFKHKKKSKTEPEKDTAKVDETIKK